jgi:hypothetical protein
MRKVKAFLEKMLDPRGPLGAVISPSDVFKERSGLPIDAPHTMRLQAQKAPDFAEHALAPERVESTTAIVPNGRIRMVSAYVEERWSPIYAQPTSITEAIRAVNTANNIVGWRVSQFVRADVCDCPGAKFENDHGKVAHVACGRAAPSKCDADDYIENIASLSIPAADDSYNVFMPTVPGQDSIATPFGIAKGGTRITQGRREYREKTAGFAHWDSGTMTERARAQHGKKVAMQERLEKHTEGAIKALPPKMVSKPISAARARAGD